MQKHNQLFSRLLSAIARLLSLRSLPSSGAPHSSAPNHPHPQLLRSAVRQAHSFVVRWRFYLIVGASSLLMGQATSPAAQPGPFQSLKDAGVWVGGGGITAAATWYLSRRQDSTVRQSQEWVYLQNQRVELAAMVKDQINGYKARVADLETRLKTTEADNATLRKELRQLHTDLNSLKHSIKPADLDSTI